MTPTAEDGVKRTLPGSTKSFTRNEAHFDYGPGDWYPEDHPAMPDIVARGRQADGIRACGLCHYPNGQGKMENGGVATRGLHPAATRRVQERDSTERRSPKANTNEMVAIARALTDAEAVQPSGFASMPWRKWVRVVESDQAPVCVPPPTASFCLSPSATGTARPTHHRDAGAARGAELAAITLWLRRVCTIGSIAKGEALVTTGGDGRTARCTVCHGTDLKGTTTAPGIAGRSASYRAPAMRHAAGHARRSP